MRYAFVIEQLMSVDTCFSGLELAITAVQRHLVSISVLRRPSSPNTSSTESDGKKMGRVHSYVRI